MKKCSICGVTEETNRIVKLRYEDVYYCSRHRQQLKEYNKITDISKPEPTKIIYCEICGESSLNTRVYEKTKHNMILCRRHNIQMNRYGKVLETTIYDRNEFIINDTYIEIITKDVKGVKTGSTYIDIKDFEKIKNYKIYKSRGYARICLPKGKKKNLHNFIMNCPENEMVDHINSEFHDGILGTLDNRRSNLRIATNQKNAFNINKGIDKGVRFKKSVNRWYAQIMYDYKSIWLGIYDTKNEALIARFIGDVLLFKDFRCKNFDKDILKLYKELSKEQIDNIKINIKKAFNKRNIIFNFKDVNDQYLQSQTEEGESNE